MKGLTRLALIAVAAVGMGLVASAPSYAIHKGAGGLVCGGCHTMHNSQGNLNLVDGLTASGGAGGGSLILLRGDIGGSRANIHNLCLQCHASNGSRGGDLHKPHDQTAPKVLLGTATWNQGQFFDRIGAGGDFRGDGTATHGCGDGTGTTVTSWTCTDGTIAEGKIHSLGATGANLIPPGGQNDGALTYLTCTNCHDPHGVENSLTTSTVANIYRMLRKAPTGSGGGTNPDPEAVADAQYFTITGTSSPKGGIAGTYASTPAAYTPVNALTGVDAVAGEERVSVWPMFSGDPSTGSTNYYSSGVATWCAACHDNWHEGNDGTNDPEGNATFTTSQAAKGDWARHPVNNIIDEGNCTTGAENGCSGAGVDIINTANYDAATAGTALPVVSGSATKRWYLQTATADRVFCLSCHFPHGGPYNDMLRWDYTSAVGADAQNAWGQDGKEVPSNRGCQLCHNRGGF